MSHKTKRLDILVIQNEILPSLNVMNLIYS